LEVVSELRSERLEEEMGPLRGLSLLGEVSSHGPL